MNTASVSALPPGPLTASAHNAQQIVAAVRAATENRAFQHTFNGQLQQGRFVVTATLTEPEADGPDLPAIDIAISAPGESLAEGHGLVVTRVHRFAIHLLLSDLDGCAPGQGRAALLVEFRNGGILLRSTEPEDGGPADYSYDLVDVGEAPPEPDFTFSFGDPADVGAFAEEVNRALAEAGVA